MNGRQVASPFQKRRRWPYASGYAFWDVNTSGTGSSMAHEKQAAPYRISRPVALRPAIYTRRVLGRFEPNILSDSAGLSIEIHAAHRHAGRRLRGIFARKLMMPVSEHFICPVLCGARRHRDCIISGNAPGSRPGKDVVRLEGWTTTDTFVKRR